MECGKNERVEYDLKDFVKKERRVATEKLRGNVKRGFSFEHKFEKWYKKKVQGCMRSLSNEIS